MNETAAAAEATGTKIGDTIDKGTSKAGNAISKLGAQGANFGIPFSNSLSKIGDKFTETSTKGEKFLGTVNEVGKVALGAGAIGLVAFGGEAIKLGNQLEDSQASLKAAVSASGESLTQWQGPIAAAQAQMEKFGFTNADVNNALAKSVISTQDVGKSLNIMSIAANLAAAKHVDLSTAIAAVDKAAQGNTKALMQMGISLPIVATNALKLQQASDAVSVAQAKVNAIQAAGGTSTVAYQTAVGALQVAEAKLAQQHAASGQILDALSQRLKGQAAAAADTFSGKMAVLKAEATDVGAQIGTKLIPVIEGMVGFLAKNKGAVEAVAIAIGVTLGAAVAVFVGTTAVSFVTGIGSMLTAIGLLPVRMATSATAIEGEDAAIVAANDAAGASFLRMLGPIGLVAGAAVAIGNATSHYSGFGGGDAKTNQTNYNAAIAAANGNKQKIASINSEAEKDNALLKKLGPGTGLNTTGIKLETAAEAMKAASAKTSDAADNTKTASNTSVSAANAALVAAQSNAAAGTAGATAAKASSSAATKAANAQISEAAKAAAAIVAEHKKAAALIVADTKAGNAALNTQINLTTATSMTALNTGLNATHNAALAKVEHTLELTHDKNLKELAISLVKTHAAALANWVAQQKAATASGNLTNATNAATVTADQQTVSNDTANLVGLTSDALAVGQAQLAVDQQKLAQDQQDAILQANVNAATTATAKATAQAAMDNYDAQQVANAANLSAALSAATNRQRLVSSGAVPALAAGGLVTRPTLALVGESGPEMVVPLSNISTQQPGPLPAIMGANSGHTVNFMPGSIVSNANPNQIATEIAWTLKTA
jgi:hypothetical protein